MDKKKNVTMDLIYCIGSVGLMNAVLQFIVYPIVNSRVGETEFGNILYLIAILNIIAPAFGLALNNTRLVQPDRDSTKNGDYNKTLIGFAVISTILAVVISIMFGDTPVECAVYAYIVMISVIRNYASVEYRLTLNFKHQLYFYIILSIGYVIGIAFFFATGLWHWIFVVGETAAVLYVVIRGFIFKNAMEESGRSRKIMQASVVLAGSYILTYSMCNLDRIVLLFFGSSEDVTKYYVLSLLGKLIAIISGPVNSVLIGYVTKGGKKVDRKAYTKLVGLVLIVGIIFTLGCSVATPIYTKIFYPNLYGSVMDLNIIVNASQVLYFITNVLLVIVLTVCHSKWQLYIQGTYSVIFVALSVLWTNANGVAGFAYSAFVSNGIFLLITVMVGILKLDKSK